MRVLGTEIIDFYDNHWPEGWYIEESDADVKIYNDDGVLQIDPAKKYNTAELGYLVKEDESGDMSFTTAFNAWKKASSPTKILIVTVPVDKAEAIVEYLRGYFAENGTEVKIKVA